jgi:aminotransferase
MGDAQRTQIRKRTSQRVDAVSATGFAKFLSLLHTISSEGQSVISLGVGEPDYRTPWHICEAAVEAFRQGYTGYTPSAGFPELRRAVAEDMESRYGVAYDPDTEILITVGSSEAIDLAFRAMLDPGDEVVVPDPYYICYPTCVELTGGVLVPVPTSAENGFKLQAADIEAYIAPRTKVLLFGYPANPTGTEMHRDELAPLARVVEQNDLLVVSDEIYSRLTYGVEHTCFASLPGMKERTILLDGFSKRYAMTGWRLGYAAGPADLIAAMGRIHQYTMLSPPSATQMAGLQALRAGEEDVRRMVAEYDRRRRVIVNGLNDIGLTCHEPEGAFYAFPSVRRTGMGSEEFTERLLLEERVVVLPGNLFGQRGEGHVRCCYATALPHIDEALARMGRFVAAHSG